MKHAKKRKRFYQLKGTWTCTVEMGPTHHGVDLESELVSSLQKAIWEEIEAETGGTREMLDQLIVAELKLFVQQEKEKSGNV